MCSNMICDIMKEIKFAKHRNKNQQKKESPILRTKESCKPGKVYRNGCQRCLCNEKREIICSGAESCEKSEELKISSLEEIHPRFKVEELENLPILPNRQVPCEPGRAYRVDCNGCVCLANQNLVCDAFACLSYDDTHRIIADDVSGKQCPINETMQLNECIECKCMNGSTVCNEIAGCVTHEERTYPIWKDGKPKLNLDIYEDKCIPKTVYRYDCNNCYCQEDGSLRCTLKTCLNYLQAQALEKETLLLL